MELLKAWNRCFASSRGDLLEELKSHETYLCRGYRLRWTGDGRVLGRVGQPGYLSRRDTREDCAAAGGRVADVRARLRGTGRAQRRGRSAPLHDLLRRGHRWR